MLVETKLGDVVKTDRGIGIVIDVPKAFNYVVQTKNETFKTSGFNIGSVRDSSELKEIITQMIKEPN